MFLVEFLNSLIAITFLICFTYSIGTNFLKIININNSFTSIIAGYCLIIIITNTLFFLDFKIQVIRNFLLLLFIISLFFIYKYHLKENILNLLKIFLNQIPIYIFLLLTIFIYGEQFYIFRGNHYDTINYTAMSLLSANFSYSEIAQIHLTQNNQFFLDFSGMFLHDRPTVSLIISLLYLPKIFDLFLVNYIFKIFFLVIVQQSFSYFLCKMYEDFGKIKIFIISNIFTFSFFTLYIFEIDAYSQLGSLGISIFFLSIIIFNDFKNFDRNLIIFLSLISSAFFLIYPEQAFVYFVLTFMYLLYKDYKNFNKNIIIFVPLFLIFTLPSFQIYEFLYHQLIFSKDFSGNWWGYFGAFILGSQNIILDESYVSIIKETIKNLDKLETIKFIYNLNIEEEGKFFFLNFLPSLVGAYYVDILKNINYILYLVIASSLNFVILYFLIKNLKLIIKRKDNLYSFFKFLIIFYILITIIFILFSNFWLIIKFYFYFSFFVFIITFGSLELNSKKENIVKKYNFLLILCLLIFPIYKYYNFNNGIGTYDSMPSVMNKYYKINYNLEIPKSKIKSCDKLYVIQRNKILDNFLAAKLLYYKKEFQFIINNNDIKKCKI
jgi:hypothetical protein